MTYDQLMDYVCDNQGCVIGTGPVTAMACEAAGFDMMVAYPFVEEGDFLPLSLHVPRILPRRSPSTDQFAWLKKFMRMAKQSRGDGEETEMRRCRWLGHSWIYDSRKERFCRRCGHHQMKEDHFVLPCRVWKDVWNLRETDLLEAMVWWCQKSEKQQDEISVRAGLFHKRMGGKHTYGDIKIMHGIHLRRMEYAAMGI